MEATALLDRVREAGAELSLRPDGQMVLAAPRGKLAGGLVIELKARKAELAEAVARRHVGEYLELGRRYDALLDRFLEAEAAGDEGVMAEIAAAAVALGESLRPAMVRVMELPVELARRVWPVEAPEVVEGAMPCWNCGGTTRWRRKDGGLVCSVCHPAVEGCEVGG